MAIKRIKISFLPSLGTAHTAMATAITNKITGQFILPEAEKKKFQLLNEEPLTKALY